MNHIQYLKQIGARGGRKRRDNIDKRELAQRAAAASWTPEARAKRLSNSSAKSKSNDKIAENKV